MFHHDNKLDSRLDNQNDLPTLLYTYVHICLVFNKDDDNDDCNNDHEEQEEQEEQGQEKQED